MTNSVTIQLLRPDDLVAIDVKVTNARLDTSVPDQPRLVRDVQGQAVLLIFRFAPQSIAEQAYFETSPIDPAPTYPPPFNPPPSSPPLTLPPALPGAPEIPSLPGVPLARMSGDSRLVFRLPSQLDGLPYSITGLLDWTHLEPVLPPAAQVPPGAAHAPGQAPPVIAEPATEETALELPYRILVAPNVTAQTSPAWRHAIMPVNHAGRTELWHTRLAATSTGSASSTATPLEASLRQPLPVRVVWSPDFVGDGPLPAHSKDGVPFTSTLSERDRDQIVILSAGFSGYALTAADGTAGTYIPQPVQAERLFLSALGGWLTSNGSWSFPVSYRYARFIETTAAPPALSTLAPPRLTETLDLVEWDHVATQGRDHYVRVVYEGFLYPFGHRASLVKVTERKVLARHGTDGNPADSPVAYLRQRMYIVVRERQKTYPAGGFAFHGREMPLSAQVRVNVAVTPDIDQPSFIGDSSFRVEVGGAPYLFPVTGVDAARADIDFLAPLIFVSVSENQLTAVQNAYAGDNGLRRCVVRGHQVAYADPANGDTVLKTTSLYFTAELSGAPGPYTDAPFLPVLDSAAVTIPSLAALTGQNTAVLITLYQPYLDHGIDPNAGVFAQVVGPAPAVSFSADKSGGFARPNIMLTALSARKGLVSGDPDDAADGLIDPTAYFGGIDAKLFGTIDLGQLIPLQAIAGAPGRKLAHASQNAPEIRTRYHPNHRHPQQLITVIHWSPQLTDYVPAGSPVSIRFNQDGQTSSLTLRVHLETHLDGTPPVSSAHGQLSDFELRLFGVIALRIANIRFDSANGAKSTVTLQLATSQPIVFEGPLAFIQTLAQILPPGLFGGSGPAIRFTPTALDVAYTIGLPPITCGVFSLQHIAIMAGLDLPYLDGKPAVEFAFASRGRPFLVTVEIFGGGGFVHVVLDADGVRMVEGALEFGANFCLDLGVASGAVSAMAGIYFQLKGTSSDLTGFIDISGEVSVLGLISISMDLNISLSWQSSPSGNIIEGRATLTVSVHVLFFSASVQLSVERSFSAGSGDPKAGQVLTAADWQEYAGSFG